MYQGYNVAHARVFDLWLPYCICSKMQVDNKSESSPICSLLLTNVIQELDSKALLFLCSALWNNYRLIAYIH